MSWVSVRRGRWPPRRGPARSTSCAASAPSVKPSGPPCRSTSPPRAMPPPRPSCRRPPEMSPRTQSAPAAAFTLPLPGFDGGDDEDLLAALGLDEALDEPLDEEPGADAPPVPAPPSPPPADPFALAAAQFALTATP